MTRKVALILTLLLATTGTNALACGTTHGSRAATAGRDPILSNYERARRALIDGSVGKVQKAANQIAAAAHETDEHAIAERSSDLANARDLAAAGQAFSALSDEVIEYYEPNGGDRLAVAYCEIEKKAWLQPPGASAIRMSIATGGAAANSWTAYRLRQTAPPRIITD